MIIFAKFPHIMRKGHLLLLLCLCLWSAQAQNALHGLYTPVQLGQDTTRILLSDYVIDEEISSLSLPEGLQNISTKPQELLLVGQLKEKMSSLSFNHQGKTENLVLVKPSAKAVEINIPLKAIGKKKELRLIGAFNNWNRGSAPLKEKGKFYSGTYLLEPGRYEYKLYLDGQEMVDPANSNKVSNGMGSFNNILVVEGDSIKPGGFAVSLDRQVVSVRRIPPAEPHLIVMWNNQVLASPCKRSYPSSCISQIPEEAKKIKRSYIRVYSYLGESKGRDQIIPLEYGEAVTSAEQLDRSDWHNARLYFLMVDRFKDGDTANNQPVPDTAIHPKANYYGGDLAGVNQKIKDEYFQNLGINSIWLSPITQNPDDAWGLWNKGKVTTKFSGYHGYWPISNIRVDYRFGTSANFSQIIDDAHADDLNVILDYVANHVHINHPIYQNNKDWATNLYLPDGTKNTEKWDEYRLTTWFDDHLPTLDLRRKEIVDPMVDSALFWVKNYDLDGFRHDATKHIDELYWRTLTKKIRALRSEPFYQIGETYGSPGLINSYISTGMLDAQFDFNLYDAAVSAFATGENLQHLKDVFEAGLATYGYHHLMGNITGNQDRARFISYASGDVKFDEDAKQAGWDREIPKAKKQAYQRLALLHAFNNSIPGIPCTYYGDEIGLAGANDPDNRRMMYFENWDANEKELYAKVQELNKLRSSELALIYGSAELFIEGSLIIIKRDYLGKTIVSILNTSTKSSEVKLPFEIANLKRLNQHTKITQSDMEYLGLEPLPGLSFHIYAN
jgi:cyclomaltodextrinase